MLSDTILSDFSQFSFERAKLFRSGDWKEPLIPLIERIDEKEMGDLSSSTPIRVYQFEILAVRLSIKTEVIKINSNPESPVLRGSASRASIVRKSLELSALFWIRKLSYQTWGRVLWIDWSHMQIWSITDRMNKAEQCFYSNWSLRDVQALLLVMHPFSTYRFLWVRCFKLPHWIQT